MIKDAIIGLIDAIACFFGHKFQIHETVKCQDIKTGVQWTEYHLRCTRCGTMKKKSMY